MPKGPKGERRPRDVVSNAVHVMRVLTGEAEEVVEARPTKNEAAAELGRKGGRKRAESMTPERRAEIARNAAERRWRKP
jgi:hypothetical protein